MPFTSDGGFELDDKTTVVDGLKARFGKDQKRRKSMTVLDDVMKQIHDIPAFVRERVEAGIKPTVEENKRLATALSDAQSRLQNLERDYRSRISTDGCAVVRDGRLAGFDILSLRILEEIMESPAWQRNRTDRARAIKEEIYNARRGLKASLTYDNIYAWQERQMKRRMGLLNQNPYSPGMMRFKEGLSSWQQHLFNQVTRAMDSTTAAAGDELVPTFEAAELMMDVNLETLVLPLLPQQAMPTNPFDVPIQLGDTNWYPITENVQVTTTDPTTAKMTLTAQGLKTGVPFSDELEEDAVIAFVAELRTSLVRNAAEIIDDVLLNADTTVTNGINSDGATISKTTAGKAHWLLGFNGLIHLPLVTATAVAKDRNGAITAADVFNQGLRYLGKYAAPRRTGDVVFISDVNTHITAMTMAEVETLDTFGARATISAGELAQVYGHPYIRSEQMLMADTDGKVTSAGNATNTGRVLTLNTTQWRVGFRRQIEVETDREPGKGQTTMYVSFRIALNDRTNGASTATHTSLVYDITGVS